MSDLCPTCKTEYPEWRRAVVRDGTVQSCEDPFHNNSPKAEVERLRARVAELEQINKKQLKDFQDQFTEWDTDAHHPEFGWFWQSDEFKKWFTYYEGLEQQLARCREALSEVCKASGEFSQDPLEHASNCIANMQQIAKEAMEFATGRRRAAFGEEDKPL